MYRVIVIGLRGQQLHHLIRRMPPGMTIRAIPPSSLLRIRRLSANLVLCTRFISHKHILHLGGIIQTRVVCSFGGMQGWADAILSEYAAANHMDTFRLAS